MSSLRFSFLQLKAVDSFISVKLSVTKMFVPSLKLCFWLFNLASFFLFSKILLQFFLLAKRTMIWMLHQVCQIYDKPLSHFLQFISDIIEITVFSKLLSSVESGIPLISMLFLLPYWAREFCSASSLTISLLLFCRKFLFSSCRHLITVF